MHLEQGLELFRELWKAPEILLQERLFALLLTQHDLLVDQFEGVLRGILKFGMLLQIGLGGDLRSRLPALALLAPQRFSQEGQDGLLAHESYPSQNEGLRLRQQIGHSSRRNSRVTRSIARFRRMRNVSGSSRSSAAISGQE